MPADAIELTDATTVNPLALDAFLRRVYSPEKCEFLHKHGLWQHRGNHNRFIVLKNGEMAGYCALIPSTITLNNSLEPIAWWIDLFVLERFRGQGLQACFDAKVRETARTLLGVPNKLAASIHKKHGWGVRQDFAVMLLPLYANRIPALQRLAGWKGLTVRAGATLARPLLALHSYSLKRRKFQNAWIIDKPDAVALASVFSRHCDSWVTTNRDVSYMHWRFLQAPHRSQMRFYGAGASPDDLSVVAISRILPAGKTLVARLLDVFGNLHQQADLLNLLKLVVQDTIASGAAQLTAVATNPQMKSALYAFHFVRVAPFRFCWISDNPAVMHNLETGQCHWCLADSDSDSSA